MCCATVSAVLAQIVICCCHAPIFPRFFRKPLHAISNNVAARVVVGPYVNGDNVPACLLSKRWDYYVDVQKLPGKFGGQSDVHLVVDVDDSGAPVLLLGQTRVARIISVIPLVSYVNTRCFSIKRDAVALQSRTLQLESASSQSSSASALDASRDAARKASQEAERTIMATRQELATMRDENMRLKVRVAAAERDAASAAMSAPMAVGSAATAAAAAAYADADAPSHALVASLKGRVAALEEQVVEWRERAASAAGRRDFSALIRRAEAEFYELTRGANVKDWMSFKELQHTLVTSSSSLLTMITTAWHLPGSAESGLSETKSELALLEKVLGLWARVAREEAKFIAPDQWADSPLQQLGAYLLQLIAFTAGAVSKRDLLAHKMKQQADRAGDDDEEAETLQFLFARAARNKRGAAGGRNPGGKRARSASASAQPRGRGGGGGSVGNGGASSSQGQGGARGGRRF